ncbi:FmdB family zinc ribbon protein [Demequina aurantiaca]|uniref:FmdB family zinc ribbon protein n=1 Tax=Demequina aurantiaca TaxID=676200 RepID=UPI000780991A|nr:FmdB family zinc ribbon protein [Demequina aurantiaca]
MPTYTYACSACQHRFDEVQSIHDDTLVACPECGGALRKVFGTVGVTFKGSGFYRTDSRETKKSAPSSSST